MIQHHLDLLQQKHEFGCAARVVPHRCEQIIDQGAGFDIFCRGGCLSTGTQLLGFLIRLGRQHLLGLEPQALQLGSHLLQLLFCSGARLHLSGRGAFLLRTRLLLHFGDLGAHGVVLFENNGFRFRAHHFGHFFHLRFHPFGLADRFGFSDFRIANDLGDPAAADRTQVVNVVRHALDLERV